MARISTYPILSTPTLNDMLIGTDVENFNETKNFLISDIASFILADNYVPYLGADRGVDLGINPLIAGSYSVGGGLSTQFLKANGTLDSTVYQPAGNYITQLSGEATASGPGNATVTLSNAAVINKALTGLTITGSVITSADSIITAFGKVQNQINTLVGGVQYKGTWNAATNTPTLVSSVGQQGYYYVVSVAGNTNLNGITDWKLGDWAIFNGSTWDKIDNTDAVISVNGQIGAVVLTTTNIAEGTNLYYTNARVRSAISLTTTGNNGASTYNAATGVFNVPQYTLAGLAGVPLTRQITINGVAQDLSADRSYSVGTVTSVATTAPLTGGTITGAGTLGITQAGAATDGYLSSTDWNTFNNKQNTIINPVTGTGTAFFLPMWGSASSLINSPLSYVSDTFNFQYNSPTGGTVVFTNSGLSTYSYTIQMNNFGSPRSTIHSYTDGIVVQSIAGVQVSRVFANGNTVFGAGVADNGHKLELDGSLFVNTIANATIDTDRFLVSDSGVIKYRTGTELLSDIGGVPSSRTLTINGVTQDLSADRTFTISTHDAVTIGTANGLSLIGQQLSLGLASGSANGALSSTDWNTFNSKQAAGNYITSLTGEVTASGPGAAVATLLNSAVIGKVLTGVNISGGTIVATDSILLAFGKVQNQINGLIGGSVFQGLWNASTNTPTLTSSVGTNGHYYIVSVDGSTNLNGITDWKVGDWAIFSGTTWTKVDNTDAVVSVNGFTGAVNLTTANIPEVTNLYYTEARVNANTNVAANTAARHNAVTLGTANGLSLSTQILSLGLASAGVAGALSGADWIVFNDKQPAGNYVTTDTVQNITGRKDFSNNTIALNANGTSQRTLVSNSPINGGSYNLAINSFGFNASNNLYFSKGGDNNGIFAFSNALTRTYTLPDASGTIALTSDLGNYIQGFGTADSIPKFTGSRSIANSAIRDTTNTVVISKNVSVDNGASQAINLTPAIGGTTNRIETTGTLPLAVITSGSSITLAAGGATPQFTLASSGAVTLTGALNGTSAGFGNTGTGTNVLTISNNDQSNTRLRIVNTGSGGQTFSIVGGTPGVSNAGFSIFDETNSAPRLSISSTGALTLGGALNGTSASFTGAVSVGLGLSAGIFNQNTPVSFSTDGTANSPSLSLFKNSSSSTEHVFRVQSFIGSVVTVASITATGAATFSSSVTAGGGAASPSIHARGGSDGSGGGKGNFRTSDGGGANFWDFGRDNLTTGNFVLTSGGGSPILSVTTTGSATFSSSVTATSFVVGNGQFYRATRTSGSLITDMIGIPSGTDNVRILTTGAFSVVSGALASLLHITPTGNVGIGTATPETILHAAQANSGGQTILYVDNNAGSALNNEAVLKFSVDNGASPTNGGAGISAINVSAGSGATDLRMLTFGTGGYLERMRITSTGNVGIGTATPGQLLTLQNTSGNPFISIVGGASASMGILLGTTGNTVDGQIFYSNSTQHLAFVTASAERMRITSGGAVLVNTISTTSAGLAGSSTLQVNNEIISRGANAGLFWENRGGGVTINSNWFGWYTPLSTTILLYNGASNIASINSSTGIYTPLSDQNKKKDFEKSTLGLNSIMGLKPTLYRMKDDESEGDKELGFIAQEVKEFIPQAYVESGEEDDKFIGLNYNAIVATLVKAIQELKTEIDSLKNQIK